MSVRLSYVVSNMRNEMLSVRLSHTWFPIWGMKWNVVCLSVIHSFQYEEWNEMSVRLSYVVSNMRNEMLSVRLSHTWFPIWGMKWNVVCPSVMHSFQYEEWNEMSVRLSYVVSNMRNEMKCCLSVSVIPVFQYEEWNGMSVRLSYVVSNMMNEMKCCLSVCHTWFPIWGMKSNVVCPSQSYVVSNMRNEMLSVHLSHTWFPIWGMRMQCCLSVSVIHGFQYEEWNEMLSVRLPYVVSNMRNEMKCCPSVCHT